MKKIYFTVLSCAVLLFLLFNKGIIPVDASTERGFEIYSINFVDTDKDEGEIGGTVTFEVKGNDTASLEKYRIQFDIDEDQSKVIGEVKARGGGMYTFTIPQNTKIPKEISTLAIRYVYKPGISVDWLGRSTGLLDNTSSSPNKIVDIPISKEVVATYDEWEAGMNSDELAPWIGVSTKYRLSGLDFKDEDITYKPEDVRYAVLYFLDEKGNKLQQIGQLYLKDGRNDFRFPILTTANMPKKTTAIGVFAKNRYGESREYVGLSLFNYPKSGIWESEFKDIDERKNLIEGKLTWIKPESEQYIKKYVIYITENGGDNIVSKIGEVNASNSASYSFSIPRGTAKTSKQRLTIVPESHGFYNGVMNFSGSFEDYIGDSFSIAPRVNGISNMDTIVTGITGRNAAVYIKVGSKIIARGKSSSAGEFSIAIPKQKAGTKIGIVSKDNTGKYSPYAYVAVQDKIAPDMPTANKVDNKAITVTGKAEKHATVTVKIGTKSYTAKANADGSYKVAIPVQNTGASILITATDSKGNRSVARTTKVVRVAPDMPTVNKVDNKATTVTGKTEKYATVTVKIGTKSYAAKANTDGSYKVSIPKQKIGTKLHVYATDVKRLSSAMRTVTVIN